MWLKRLTPGDKPVPERQASSAYIIFDPSNWEIIRKDNIMVLLSDLERPPNLPRPSPQPPPPPPNPSLAPGSGPGQNIVQMQLPGHQH